MRGAMFKFVMLAAAIGVCSLTASAQAVVYVDDSAPAGGDGLTWATAYASLQDAINLSPTSTTLRVGGGVYKPDQGAGIVPLNKGASFRLKDGMVLRGGYRGLGGGGSPDDRDPTLFRTLLSGDLGNNDPGVTDNTFNIVRPLSFAAVRVEGVTIKGGVGPTFSADGSGGGFRQHGGNAVLEEVNFQDCSGYAGGAIRSVGAALTLRDCTFERVSALFEGSVLFTNGSLGTLIERCRFVQTPNVLNRTPITLYGGSSEVRESYFESGVSTDPGGVIRAESENLLVSNCTFRETNATNNGGAVWARDGSLTIRDSLFFQCSAALGGGGYGGGVYKIFGGMTIERCRFDGCSAPLGGAVFVTSVDSCTISDCSFESGFATNSGAGGAIYASAISTSPAVIQRCRFESNTASRGGALYLNSLVLVSRCVFLGNQANSASARFGAHVYVGGGPTSVVGIDHCTFAQDRPTSAPAITTDSFQGSLLSIRNSIVRRDAPGPNQPQQITQNFEGTILVEYCNVESPGGLMPGVGNMDFVPHYVSIPLGDLRLRPGSAGIDRADPLSPLDPDGTRADIGARPFDSSNVWLPRTYCTAGVSTLGCSPQLAWSGQPSLSASQPFVLTAGPFEGQRKGSFVYSLSGPAEVLLGNSSSRRCVAAPFAIPWPLALGGSLGTCSGSLALDWNALMNGSTPVLGEPFAVGDAIWIQAWGRDPAGPVGSVLSNALEFVLDP
jgi:hypothetical protein